MDKPTAAAVVWATPELRSLIINEMEINEVLKSICLSKSTFPDMVRKLYPRFEYHNYPDLHKLAVPVGTHGLEKVRELIFSTSVASCTSSQYVHSESN
jgi:hypothetical protein